jgi:hypothetical protein
MTDEALFQINSLLKELIPLVRELVDAIAKQSQDHARPTSLEPASWYSANQIAKSRGVTPNKVLGWINSGELKAINCATKMGGMPRWKVSEESLAAFDRLRESGPPTPKQRVKKLPHTGKQYV